MRCFLSELPVIEKAAVEGNSLYGRGKFSEAFFG